MNKPIDKTQQKMMGNKNKAKLKKQLGYLIAAISCIGGLILAVCFSGLLSFLVLVFGLVGALVVGALYDTLGTVLEEVVELRSTISYGNTPDNPTVSESNITNP